MSKRTCYAGDVNTDYLDQEVTLKRMGTKAAQFR